MRRYGIISFLALVLLAGCSTVENLREYETGTNTCHSTIEGELVESDKWIGDAPLLVERTVGRNFEYRKGKIVDITDNGVLYDEDRRSMANNPAPEFYEFDDIYSLIDSTKTLISGTYPDSRLRTDYFEFYLQKIGSEEKLKKFRLEPGRSFQFCIDPGEYSLSSVVWMRQDGNSDVSSPFYTPGHTFTIEAGMANYLGGIYVNHSEKQELANHYEFYMEELERPNRDFYIYTDGVEGLILGIAGTIFTELMRERGIVSVLDLQIVDDLAYESVSGHPVRFTELYLY